MANRTSRWARSGNVICEMQIELQPLSSLSEYSISLILCLLSILYLLYDMGCCASRRNGPGSTSLLSEHFQVRGNESNAEMLIASYLRREEKHFDFEIPRCINYLALQYYYENTNVIFEDFDKCNSRNVAISKEGKRVRITANTVFVFRLNFIQHGMILVNRKQSDVVNRKQYLLRLMHKGTTIGMSRDIVGILNLCNIMPCWMKFTLSDIGYCSGFHSWSVRLLHVHNCQALGITEYKDATYRYGYNVFDSELNRQLGDRYIYAGDVDHGWRGSTEMRPYIMTARDHRLQYEKRLKLKDNRWRRGDVITVQIDFTADLWTILFLKNGERLREKMEVQKKTTYYPVFQAYSKGTFEIIEDCNL